GLMRPDKRLSAVIGMIEAGSVVADVGTDHGYVPITLVKEGISPRAFAMDVRPGPLEKAKDNAERFECSSMIRFILSDGLKELPAGEADTVVITGMGGMLINRILAECPDEVLSGIRTFILGPQSEAELFRRSIVSGRYTIESECLVRENGKYYPLIRASRGRGGMKERGGDGAKRLVPLKELKPCDFRYGRFLLSMQDPLLREKIGTDIKTVGGVLKDRKHLPENRIRELEEELEQLKEALDCYEMR
nr:class I SAM-dependent methyltransferase [Lachnospiraceae bacterium]